MSFLSASPCGAQIGDFPSSGSTGEGVAAPDTDSGAESGRKGYVPRVLSFLPRLGCPESPLEAPGRAGASRKALPEDDGKGPCLLFLF